MLSHFGFSGPLRSQYSKSKGHKVTPPPLDLNQRQVTTLSWEEISYFQVWKQATVEGSSAWWPQRNSSGL
jgi:hypothetical protein